MSQTFRPKLPTTLLYSGLTIVVLAAITTSFHLYSLDGLDGWALYVLKRGDHQTVYAPGYTDSGFRRIRKGMPESEVTAILGDPLSKARGYWTYTDQATSLGDFFRREVHVERGVVVGKSSEFFLD